MTPAERQLLKRQSSLRKRRAKLLRQKARIDARIAKVEEELKKMRPTNWLRQVISQAQMQLEHWPKEVRSTLNS